MLNETLYSMNIPISCMLLEYASGVSYSTSPQSALAITFGCGSHLANIGVSGDVCFPLVRVVLMDSGGVGYMAGSWVFKVYVISGALRRT